MPRTSTDTSARRAWLRSMTSIGNGRSRPLLCGTAAVFDDPLRLIRDDRVDAILIASPDATHPALVLECLRCRKPVLCEKPLATSAADAARVIEAESALGRRLVAVGLMRRFDPYHVAVRQVVASQQLGRPILYKGVHRNAAIPYDARGEVIVTNSAGHDIDAVRWLLGQEIEEVYVRGVRSHAAFSAETTDLLLVQMTLTGDCLATIELYMAAEYGYEVSAEIVSERGAVVNRTARQCHCTIRAGAFRGGARRLAGPFSRGLRGGAGTVGRMRFRAGQPFPGASAWDGYVALLVTDACVRSLRSRSPVAVQTPARPLLYANADV